MSDFEVRMLSDEAAKELQRVLDEHLLAGIKEMERLHDFNYFEHIDLLVESFVGFLSAYIHDAKLSPDETSHVFDEMGPEITKRLHHHQSHLNERGF